MAITDPVVLSWVDGSAHWMHDAAPAAGAMLVVAVGKLVAAHKEMERQAEAGAGVAGGEPGGLEAEQPAPPGYRWVSRLWRTLPDGTRDYAAYYGKTAFRFLVPMSSKLRSPKR
jgi:hypothetical protein